MSLFIVEIDVSEDPMNIGFLGGEGIVVVSQHFPYLIQQFKLSVGNELIFLFHVRRDNIGYYGIRPVKINKWKGFSMLGL